MRRLHCILPFVALLAIAATTATAQSPAFGLYPYPKSIFGRATSFDARSANTVVVPDNQSQGAASAVELLRSQMREISGVDLAVIPESQYNGGPAIMFAQAGVSVAIDARIRSAMPPGETFAPSGGYVLDVTDRAVLIVATDIEGMFSAVSTLRPLTNANGTIVGVHVWDYPDYPARWVFNMQNLRGVGAIGALRSILDTMSRYKLNAIQQNDFKYGILKQQPPWYFDSTRAFRSLAEARGIDIVPGVAGIGYSEAILWNDPNLAEGFPANARYVIEADTARLVPDTRVSIPNGSFESVDANGKFTGWSFYDESTASVDRTIVHSGSTSARCSNFSGVNSRFSRAVQCRPNSAYVMTAWLRTEQLNGGELRLLAIGTDAVAGSRVLTHTMLGLSGTSNGWRQVQVVFNTLEYREMNLYVGLWGGGTGMFWVDDFQIRDHGLTNVLRRTGTPVHVRSPNGATEYSEGIDFAPIVDTRMTNGIYPWHEPPPFRSMPGGALRNGDSIVISYFHPVTTYGDENGIGQNMVCLSDDTLHSILREQISGVDSLYSPSIYLMQHDEIRVLNRDSACLARNMSPAELLADNVARTAALIDSIHPGAKVAVWSDMFDSLHNAVDDYYLVNGDLRGVWNGIPRSIAIVNWNGGQNMRKSLDFFASHGFRQIASPYYDERDTRNIRRWRLALESTPRADGMMYTTWVGDYSFLRAFAFYAWGAGPNLSHTPLDSGVLMRPALDSVRIDAIVWADPYDATDRIASVVARIDIGGTTEDVTLTEGAANTFTGFAKTIGRDAFTYSITARNAQGLERTTPEYIVSRASASSVASSAPRMLSASIRPNPVDAAATISFVPPEPGGWTLTIVDALGRVVYTSSGSATVAEVVSMSLDGDDLAPGAYRCEIRSGEARRIIGFVAR